MPTGLTAYITNSLPSGSQPLLFNALAPVHGQPPAADPTSLNPGSSSTVLAPVVDPVFGPSSQGSFEFILAGNAGSFVFQYDFHDSPSSFSCKAPPGYNASTTLGQDGNCTATLTVSPVPSR